MRRSLLLITLLSASLVPCVAATDGVPAGWFLAGDHPQNYRVGSDGEGIEYLASNANSNGEGFGTLMRSSLADNYRGKRVRFSASVRSDGIDEWAGLWMRVDAGNNVVAFDNMQSRPIKGSTLWHTYEVVLDVPPDATKIAFGTLIVSRGEVWMDHAFVETVGTNVPTTGRPITPHPLQ